MEKAFSCGKTGKWPEKRRTGKRANEIECPEKGKGKAPNLKSRARFRKIQQALRWIPFSRLGIGQVQKSERYYADRVRDT